MRPPEAPQSAQRRHRQHVERRDKDVGDIRGLQEGGRQYRQHLRRPVGDPEVAGDADPGELPRGNRPEGMEPDDLLVVAPLPELQLVQAKQRGEKDDEVGEDADRAGRAATAVCGQ
jgi:hypothetical protein